MMDAEQAREVLRVEEQKRLADCQAAIRTVLDRYGCRLDVSVTLRRGEVIPQVRIVPK